MSMKKVTENERRVFEFIKQRLEEGYPPTVREICAEFGFKSTSTAHRYIRSLSDKGLLEKGLCRMKIFKKRFMTIRKSIWAEKQPNSLSELFAEFFAIPARRFKIISS